MGRSIIIEVDEDDAQAMATLLDDAGRKAIDVSRPRLDLSRDTDPERFEMFDGGIRMCSLALQLRIGLHRLRDSDTVSLVKEPPAATPAAVQAGNQAEPADEPRNHDWKVGDQVHHKHYDWSKEWRGPVSGLHGPNFVTVEWEDGIPTTLSYALLETDDGREYE